MEPDVTHAAARLVGRRCCGALLAAAASWMLAAASTAAASSGDAPVQRGVPYPVPDRAVAVSGEQPLKLRWRSLNHGRDAAFAMDGRLQVHLTLDVQAWRGRQARIYQIMELQPIRVQVRWVTVGLLMPGSSVPGQRVLVYQGLIGQAMLQDTLDVLVTAHGPDMDVQRALQFRYEIELIN